VLPFAIPKKDPAIADARPLLYLSLTAEPEDLRPGAAGQSAAGGIVGIQDREIFSLLILENARLRVRVGFECAVAVEVVGGEEASVLRYIRPDGWAIACDADAVPEMLTSPTA
jgi:hypothetical protein